MNQGGFFIFDFTQRTQSLLGDEAMERLSRAFVLVVGIGGVGGACAEALVRCGVGHMLLLDHDEIDITNVNRQLFATSINIGDKKTEAAKKRLLEINPELELITLPVFFNADTSEQAFEIPIDYVVDAIDTVSSKLLLICECKKRDIPIISSLGTGNRLDPTEFLIGNISDTAGCGCGLARVMRRELKARGITDLDVLYSKEYPRSVISSSENGRHSPASISFCPPVAGYIIASHVVKRIIA